MSDQLTAAMADLKKLQAELAFVSEQLAGARYARRAVRDRVAAACVRTDEIQQVVLHWRPPTPGEVAEIDEVCARHAPTLREYEPRERALKEAVRIASIEVEKARSAATSERGKNADKTRKDFPRSTPEPLKGMRNAEHFRVRPSLTRSERGPASPSGQVPKPEQGGFWE